MADPNRKINLEFPEEEDEPTTTSDESDHVEFDPEEITLVKDFEEEFKHRFTEEDEIFSEFCKRELKPPPIVFPYDGFQGGHGHRGGGGRGGGGYRNHRGGGNWRGGGGGSNWRGGGGGYRNDNYRNDNNRHNSYHGQRQHDREYHGGGGGPGSYGEHKRRRFND